MITKKFSGRSKEKNISHVQTFRGWFQEFGRFLSLLNVQEGFLFNTEGFDMSLSRTFKVLIKLRSLTSLNRYVALITVVFVSCLISSIATVGQVAIIHRSLIFSSTPIGTIIFCLYVINGLSLFGILCVSIGCMIIAARLICSRKDSVHFNKIKLRVFFQII